MSLINPPRHLFVDNEYRVAMARSYAHFSTRMELRPVPWEEMRFSRVVDHEELGRCLIGGFLAGIGMFDVHFPVRDTRALDDGERQAMRRTVYRWGSGREDRYPAHVLISAPELAVIRGNGVSFQQAVFPADSAKRVPVNDDDRPTATDTFGRPSKRAIHQAVRNVLFNELGLTKESLGKLQENAISSAIREQAAQFLGSGSCNRMMLNMLAELLQRPSQRKYGNNAEPPSTAMADYLQMIITGHVEKIVSENLSVFLRVTPQQIEDLEKRSRIIDLEDGNGVADSGSG